MGAGGGFSATGQVRPATQSEILLAIVAKIQASVPALEDESCCYVSDQSPSVEVQENLFATVYPSDGQFDQNEIDGGGNLQVNELFTVIVSIWSRIEVDQLERFEQGLLDPTRGLTSLKAQVLTALAGKNLDGGTYQGNDSLLLLEALSPSKSRFKAQEEDGFGSVTIGFSCHFNWLLGDGQTPIFE